MKRSKIKYLVVPGEIGSKRDEDVHYISEFQLMRLYGVNPKECLIYKGENSLRGYHQEMLNKLILLNPRHDGNYSLPSKKKE